VTGIKEMLQTTNVCRGIEERNRMGPSFLTMRHRIRAFFLLFFLIRIGEVVFTEEPGRQPRFYAVRHTSKSIPLVHCLSACTCLFNFEHTIARDVIGFQ